MFYSSVLEKCQLAKKITKIYDTVIMLSGLLLISETWYVVIA